MSLAPWSYRAGPAAAAAGATASGPAEGPPGRATDGSGAAAVPVPLLGSAPVGLGPPVCRRRSPAAPGPVAAGRGAGAGAPPGTVTSPPGTEGRDASDPSGMDAAPTGAGPGRGGVARAPTCSSRASPSGRRLPHPASAKARTRIIMNRIGRISSPLCTTGWSQDTPAMIPAEGRPRPLARPKYDGPPESVPSERRPGDVGLQAADLCTSRLNSYSSISLSLEDGTCARFRCLSPAVGPPDVRAARRIR